MIPKKIHYCWFGRGELSAKAKKCIKSWKKYCPDYEMIFVFLSDYARLKIVYEQGGIYLDLDVEIIKPKKI